MDHGREVGVGKGTVIVTGAGIGIGRATALAFAKAGHHAVVTDVLARAGEDAVRAILEAGGSAEFHALDVTDSAACDRVVKAVESRHGPVGTLVLNAGIAHRIPLTTMSDAEWDRTLDVDLKGMMRVLRAAAPAMRAAKHGTVLCIASVVGTRYGWAEHIPYSAAKPASPASSAEPQPSLPPTASA
jgi:3-oxoacyl-[acyl-carrier protein] reductase